MSKGLFLKNNSPQDDDDERRGFSFGGAMIKAGFVILLVGLLFYAASAMEDLATDYDLIYNRLFAVGLVIIPAGFVIKHYSSDDAQSGGTHGSRGAVRRFFHNALNSLKKDKGAHFTYNLGVSLVRAGVVVLLIALAFLVPVLVEYDPYTEMSQFYLQVLIPILLIGLAILLIGIREERIAMKYPRNDVEISETAIVLSEEETDDLLEEFDREYKKQHPNWLETPHALEDSQADRGEEQ